jgi:hypothetical protein
MPSQCDLAVSDAGGLLTGRLVTEHLLDGRGEQFRITPEAFEFVWIAQQGEQPVATQVGRRLPATHPWMTSSSERPSSSSRAISTLV